MAEEVKGNDQAIATRVELRVWNLLVAACLMLGGWWLQNQYDTTLRLQGQLTEFIRHVDDKYVEKEFLKQIDADQDRRFNQLEDKIERLIDAVNGLRDARTGTQTPIQGGTATPR
jgi:hypothetical protein